MLLLELCVCLLMWTDTYYLETQQSRSNVDGYALHEGINWGSQERISQKFVKTLGQKAKDEKPVHSLGLPIPSWLKKYIHTLLIHVLLEVMLLEILRNHHDLGSIHRSLEFSEYIGRWKNDNSVSFILIMSIYICVLEKKLCLSIFLLHPNRILELYDCKKYSSIHLSNKLPILLFFLQGMRFLRCSHSELTCGHLLSTVTQGMFKI